MKKLLITALAAITLSATANAGSISLDARGDFEVNQYNDAAEAAATNPRDNHRFLLHTLRLDSVGNLNESTSYRLRFRFNNGALGSRNTRDNLNSAIDFSYIQHRFMENFSVQLGKFGTDIGGIEGMTAGPDLYLTSEAYSEQSPLRYGTGIKGSYSIVDQEFAIMTTNQQTDADENGGTAGGFNQDREAFGIVYKGNFMDKTLMPVLSYHEDNLQPTDTTGVAALAKKNTYSGAGLKFDMSPFFVEADYLYNVFGSRSVDDQDDKVTTAVATIGGRMMENFVLKAKYEYTEEETYTAGTTSGKDKINGYQLAFEYLPTGEKHFRYHVAYVQKDTKPETGDTRTSQQALAGVRIFHDFLK